jgi:hypothetical protein
MPGSSSAEQMVGIERAEREAEHGRDRPSVM